MWVIQLFKNKYFLVVIAIIVWLLYFDRNDVFSQFELVRRCNKLKAEKNYYEVEITNNKKELDELRHNAKSLETFAREKYYMKKDNEDVFVFVNPKK